MTVGTALGSGLSRMAAGWTSADGAMKTGGRVGPGSLAVQFGSESLRISTA